MVTDKLKKFPARGEPWPTESGWYESPGWIKCVEKEHSKSGPIPEGEALWLDGQRGMAMCMLHALPLTLKPRT